MKQTERDKLILDNLGLIYKCIFNLHLLYINEEEFENLYYYGIRGLMNGIDTYNADKSSQSTYYYTCIKYKILQYLKSKETSKRKIDSIPKISLNMKVKSECEASLQEIIPSNEKFEDKIEEKIRIEKIIQFLESRYSKNDVLIFRLHFGLCNNDPMPARELSEVFNIHQKTIESKIAKMRQLLKRHKNNF